MTNAVMVVVEGGGGPGQGLVNSWSLTLKSIASQNIFLLLDSVVCKGD